MNAVNTSLKGRQVLWNPPLQSFSLKWWGREKTLDLDFSNLPITRTKNRFSWISLTQSNIAILLPISRTNFHFPWRFDQFGKLHLKFFLTWAINSDRVVARTHGIVRPRPWWAIFDWLLVTLTTDIWESSERASQRWAWWETNKRHEKGIWLTGQFRIPQFSHFYLCITYTLLSLGTALQWPWNTQ